MEMAKSICMDFLDVPVGRYGTAEFIERYARHGMELPSLSLATACLVLLTTLMMPSPIEIGAGIKTARPKPHRVTVTAYTNVEACTDSTPNETASLLQIKPRHYGKIIALSRDLAKQYRFGDRFELRLNGRTHIVEYQDLMNKRFKNRIDLLLPSVRKSLKFGVNEGMLIPLDRQDRKPGRRMG